MRVAAIYDIHGNLPALQAVLEEIERAAVDVIVVGGDVVPGPMPRETIATLMNRDPAPRFIQGNGEREVLALRAGAEPDGVPEPFRDAVSWVGRELTNELAQSIASWPRTMRLAVPGLGEVLFCHATPRSDSEIFTRLTPEDRLLPIFDSAAASLVVCGHTHMQFDRIVGTTRVVNAGSVGMPFGEPGAYWLLLGPDVELRRSEYDLEAAAARIRATAYPLAAEHATGSVLHPPAESEMLERFEQAALR